MADGMITWGERGPDEARPTGPLDPEFPVWVFRGPDDKLLGVTFNHSTHTIGTLKPGVRSPSFYGLAAQAVEAEFGAPVEFLEGASGSTHNFKLSVATMIERLRHDLVEGIEQAQPRSPPDRGDPAAVGL